MYNSEENSPLLSDCSNQEEEVTVIEETDKKPPETPKKHSFHFLSGILTFILLPHFWCFSIPALIFSNESKKFFKQNNFELSLYFADKAKRFIIVSWLLTLSLGALVLLFTIFISLSLL